MKISLCCKKKLLGYPKIGRILFVNMYISGLETHSFQFRSEIVFCADIRFTTSLTRVTNAMLQNVFIENSLIPK